MDLVTVQPRGRVGRPLTARPARVIGRPDGRQAMLSITRRNLRDEKPADDANLTARRQTSRTDFSRHASRPIHGLAPINALLPAVDLRPHRARVSRLDAPLHHGSLPEWFGPLCPGSHTRGPGTTRRGGSDARCRRSRRRHRERPASRVRSEVLHDQPEHPTVFHCVRIAKTSGHRPQQDRTAVRHAAHGGRERPSPRRAPCDAASGHRNRSQRDSAGSS